MGGLFGDLYNALTGQNGGQVSASSLATQGLNSQAQQANPTINPAATATIQAQQAAAAQAAPNSFQPGEQALVGQLAAQAAGGGPSLAQQQLKQATQGNIATQLATAAGARGNQNPGAAAYGLGQGAAAANQAAAGQAATTRAGEQLGAEQALAGAQGTFGAAQNQFNESNAALAQQAALQNATQGNQIAEANATNAQAGNALAANVSESNAAQQNALTGQENQIIGQGATAAQTASGNFGTGIFGGVVNGLASAAQGALAGGGAGVGGPMAGGGAAKAPACPDCSVMAGGGLCFGHEISKRMAGGGIIPSAPVNGFMPISTTGMSGPIAAMRADQNAAALANGGGALEPLPGASAGLAAAAPAKPLPQDQGPASPKMLPGQAGGHLVRLGEKGPEVVVPVDGSQGDPHEFLSAMMKKLGDDGENIDMRRALKKAA